MAKLKTLKALAKRVKKNFQRKKANKSHLLRKKNSKRKRTLSRKVTLTKVQQKLMVRLVFS